MPGEGVAGCEFQRHLGGESSQQLARQGADAAFLPADKHPHAVRTSDGARGKEFGTNRLADDILGLPSGLQPSRLPHRTLNRDSPGHLSRLFFCPLFYPPMKVK